MFFFERAFRPFFLGGAGFAVLSMAVWWWFYPNMAIMLGGINALSWHAHEMVFGYALATVTGFLLTAVMNWSGLNSASGKNLAFIFLAWLLARFGFIADAPLEWIAAFDLVFNLGLALHFSWPVFHKRLGEQAGLAAKFWLLALVNMGFYGAVLGLPYAGVLNEYQWVVLGLFLILSINLTMIRRVMPFFTEKTLRLKPIKPFKWVNRLAMLGFLSVMILSVLSLPAWLTTVAAWAVAALFALRAWRWYHPKIWGEVLLWPLHVSYAFMTLGMVLYGAWGMGWVSQSLALHALTAGGIGLLCSAMVARISLGHTNRDVFSPPKHLVWVFVVLALGAVARVIMPLVWPQETLLWMQISQILWILGFAGLIFLYAGILLRSSPAKKSGIKL